MQQMVGEQRQECLNEMRRKFEYSIEQKLCNSKEKVSQGRINKEPRTEKQHSYKGKQQSVVNQSCKNPSPSLLDLPEPKLGTKNMKKTRKPSVDQSNSKLNTKRCTTEQANVNKPEQYEWEKGAVLILGDSMISGIEKKDLAAIGQYR